MAQPIVKIRGVSKSFGKKLVLNDVNLDINEGEIFGIIGTSGAGKTTLLQSMVGFYPINKGEIAYKSNDQNALNYISIKQNDEFKQKIGFSTQAPSFYDRLTVKENLDYFANLYNIPKQFIEQRIRRIIDVVELTGDENTLGGELSGGMQKRLDIACSLINDPQILILDEPTADLDPLLRRHVWALIKKINKLGKTIIVSSHFLDEIEALCTRIGVIYDKQIVHVGTTEDLRKVYPCDNEIVLSLASQNYTKIASLLKSMPIKRMAVRGNKMLIYTNESDIVLKKLLDVIEQGNEKVLELDVQRLPLDEVFASIITKKG